MRPISLDEPESGRVAAPAFALFELGFRPFYLLAALFAAVAVPLWALLLGGVFALPLPGMMWHAHEMLFGFAAAVIVGFLFTAGRNWTGLPTPTGGALALLALLWLAGRLATGISVSAWSSVVDLAFLPAAAFALGRVLWRANSRRNYFVLVLLALLSLLNLAFHLAHHQLVAIEPLTALHGALGIVVVLETVIAGRVIPGFTSNALRGVRLRQNLRLDQSAIGVGALALALWAGDGVANLVAPVALIAAVLHLLRWSGWQSWQTRKQPLLWILHLSYLWIPVGLGLLALAQWGFVPRSAGVHALAIGATGGLIIGMITRTALGHTGRMLVAGRIETSAYVLVQLAAVIRVLTLLVVPVAGVAGIYLAAMVWSSAFALYLVRYMPFLWRARVDGRPG